MHIMLLQGVVLTTVHTHTVGSSELKLLGEATAKQKNHN